MTVMFKLRNQLDPVYVDGDFGDVVNGLNLAAAAGRQFAMFDEKDGGPIAFETRNITMIREVDDDEAFIS